MLYSAVLSLVLAVTATASSIPRRSAALAPLLQARQDISDISARCQSQCTALFQATSDQCLSDVNCICTSAAVNGIAQCYNCLASEPNTNALNVADANATLKTIASNCASAGVDITPPTITGGSSGSGSGAGTDSGTSTGTGNGSSTGSGKPRGGLGDNDDGVAPAGSDQDDAGVANVVSMGMIGAAVAVVLFMY